MKKYYCFALVLLIIMAMGFTRRPEAATGTRLQFEHRAGNKILHLFDETYINRLGEPFTINKFRYFLSHITFTDANNKETLLANNYYLVNEEDSLSKIIQLPATGITSLSFEVGVDSARNVSGVQTGTLDPVNGMFWTWNSGYIFAKLEGQSDSSHAPAHSFSWDIGGFRKKENALKKITLTIPAGVTARNNTIVVRADILQWFDAVHPVSISSYPVCHQPGKLAMMVADNYSAMFSVAP